MDEFCADIRTHKPRVAVLMAPLGVEMGEYPWGLFAQVDSTKFGDVLGSIWQIWGDGASGHEESHECGT